MSVDMCGLQGRWSLRMAPEVLQLCGNINVPKCDNHILTSGNKKIDTWLNPKIYTTIYFYE